MTNKKSSIELYRARAKREYDRLSSMGGAYVKLAISSDSLAPEEITQRLGIEPTEVFQKGDFIVETENYKHHHSANLWIFHTDSHCSSRQVEEHLKWLLDEQLYDKRQGIRDLQGDGATVSIYAHTNAFVSTSFMRLDPDIFQKLASLKVEVELRTKLSY